jgi:hypothetical protein
MTNKKEKVVTYIIKIELTNDRTCEFKYNDPILAKEEFLKYTSQGIISGQLIKSIELV